MKSRREMEMFFAGDGSIAWGRRPSGWDSSLYTFEADYIYRPDGTKLIWRESLGRYTPASEEEWNR